LPVKLKHDLNKNMQTIVVTPALPRKGVNYGSEDRKNKTGKKIIFKYYIDSKKGKLRKTIMSKEAENTD